MPKHKRKARKSSSDTSLLDYFSPVSKPHQKKHCIDTEGVSMDEIRATLNSIQQGQKNLADKFDDLEKGLELRFKALAREMKDGMDLEISQIIAQIDKQNEKIESLRRCREEDMEFDPEFTLVATNYRYEPDEDPFRKASKLIEDGLDLQNVQIINACRLQDRNGKPGIFKIQLSSKEAKISCLRAKSKLKSKAEFRQVFLRSSKPHVERVQEFNMKTLLNELPQLSGYRLAGNGRLVLRSPDSENRNNIHQQQSRHPQGRVTSELASNGLSSAGNNLNMSAFIDEISSVIDGRPHLSVDQNMDQRGSHGGARSRDSSSYSLTRSVQQQSAPSNAGAHREDSHGLQMDTMPPSIGSATMPSVAE